MWRKIEDDPPPKDGTVVLLWIDGDIFQGQREGKYWTFAVASFHGCGCCGYPDDNPTHWMPLPAPPQE